MIKKILIVLSIILVLGLMWGISVKGDIIQAEDKSGNIWEYKGSARIGDDITLVMHDNHTSKITDDIVKEVK